jgi:lysozyme family protein
MKENFDLALAHVLESEGGWSDDSTDAGGATMKGVTFAVFKEFKRNPHLTKDDLKNISDQDIHDIYKQLYWDKHGDDLPAGIDYAVFDSAVNMGVGRASKLIQEAVGVTADGVLGPASLSAIQKADPKELIEKFSELKNNFYHGIVESRPDQVKYLNGWLIRVTKVKSTSESMIA